MLFIMSLQPRWQMFPSGLGDMMLKINIWTGRYSLRKDGCPNLQASHGKDLHVMLEHPLLSLNFHVLCAYIQETILLLKSYDVTFGFDKVENKGPLPYMVRWFSHLTVRLCVIWFPNCSASELLQLSILTWPTTPQITVTTLKLLDNEQASIFWSHFPSGNGNTWKHIYPEVLAAFIQNQKILQQFS